MGLGSFLSGLVGANPVAGGVKAAAALIGKFVETPEQKQALAELADAAEKREHQLADAQLAVNKTEAAHRSLFVAGWRPWLGWILGTNLGALGFVLSYRVLMGLPLPDLQPLWPFFSVLFGMLGLGAGLRTREKTRGVAK